MPEWWVNLFLVLEMKIDVVQLEIKKAYEIELELNKGEIHSAFDASHLFCKTIGNLNVEHVAMITLDNADNVVNFFTISIGGINSVKVSLAQMFRVALLSNTSKIIIAHNHPSGVLQITSKDIEMTRKIAFFAKNFDIELMDSMVVTGADFISIRAHCEELSDEQRCSD